MSWAKLDDRANEHRKQLAAGAEACWLWACGLMYANRQPARDGFIPEIALRALYVGVKRPEKLAAKLVEVGLWDRVEGGWVVHDFTEWNKTREQVEAEREAARERMSLVRANRERTSGEHQTEHDPKFAGCSGSTPTPIPSDSKSDPPVSPPLGDQPPLAKPKRRKPRTEAPESIEPSPANQALAMKHDVDLPSEIPKFLAHHKAKGNTMADWQKALETWILGAPGFRRQGKPPGLEQHEQTRLPSNYRPFPVARDVGRRVPSGAQRPPPVLPTPEELEAQAAKERAAAEARAAKEQADRERWERDFKSELEGKAS